MWNRIKHTQCVLKRTRSDLTLAASSADGPLGGHSAARGSSGGEGENTGLTVQRGRAEDGGWGMGEKDEGRARGTQVGRVKEKREPRAGVRCLLPDSPKASVPSPPPSPAGAPPGPRDPRRHALSLLVPMPAGSAGDAASCPQRAHGRLPLLPTGFL